MGFDSCVNDVVWMQNGGVLQLCFVHETRLLARTVCIA